MLKSNKFTYKGYVKTLLLVGFTPVALLAIVNFLIDPYEVFQSGIFKEVGATEERYLKIEFLKKNQTFNTFLLGGSRIGTIDPKNVERENPEISAYNFFVSSGNQYDNLLHVQWLLKNYPNLRNIYIQVDWPDRYGEEREYLQYFLHPEVLNKSSVGFLNKFLFSLPVDAIKFKIKNNFSNKGQFKLDLTRGNYYYPNRDHSISTDCMSYVNNMIEFNRVNVEKSESEIQKTVNTQSLDSIKRILSLVSDKNINIIIFITPHNKNFLNKINLKEYTDFLINLSEITPFYNFGFYNSITNNNCNYYESSHYIPSVGGLIFSGLNSSHADKEMVRYTDRKNINQETLFIKNNFLINRATQ